MARDVLLDFSLGEDVNTGIFGGNFLFHRLFCTNRVRDSSRESSVVAGMDERTHPPDLQDQELASLQ